MSVLFFELPVAPWPQDFQVTLRRRRTFRFVTQYRTADEAGWLIDLFDVTAGAPLVRGIAVVTGLDLVWQYDAFDLGFHLIMQCGGGRTTPTFESFGVEDRLILVYKNADAQTPLQVVLNNTPLYPIDLQIAPGPGDIA